MCNVPTTQVRNHNSREATKTYSSFGEGVVWGYMDFIKGLPCSERVDTILVKVDQLSKYAPFMGLCHPFIAVLIAATSIRKIVCLHGIPWSVISDHEKVNHSFFFFGRNCLYSKVQHSNATSHVTLKRMSNMRWLIDILRYLRRFASTQPHSWERCLPWAEYWFNTLIISLIIVLPFEHFMVMILLLSPNMNKVWLRSLW